MSEPSRTAGGVAAEEPVPFPFSPVIGLDVDPAYAALRERPSLLRVSVPYGHDAWLATRHEDVRAVLADPRFSRAASADHDEPRLTPLPLRTSVMGLDPPDHTRLRTVVSHAFTMRRVENLRPWVHALADRLLDEMVEQGPPADLANAFCVPLAGRVVCALLGIPFEDREKFQTWLRAHFTTTEMSADEVAAGMRALRGYLAELVERRRHDPRDDLVTALVRACDEERRCTEEELVGLVSILLIAGHDTTAFQMSASAYVLLTHPEQADLLRSRPELASGAVEELLRYVPLIAHVSFARYATEDVLVGGTLVREGDAVLPAIPSANRDEAVFPHPDRLDFRRASNPHLGFGFGPHRCLGAALVRMQMRVVLPKLLARLPDLRLAVPAAEVPWATGIQARTVESLPVTWGARRAGR
ncbi:Cytochrome P450 [Streptoalloteichus tenebrarius]|uniref:Cytochrome P450 n=1 Tax=Streptoalloteichus tenebrarius (strain ATCC 17920 / DSM 40477 / JCM 4838 / CBS 697.72 / NBRC 16177 / NCIMB 11028 / NRRL B-12390 / A12253. 1 / ISP 5477) TaxID=1933 RepID=A0ABT1HSL9_STRSD|nr:cytochrome P450 [Streptoalloteichus tenebrarius]MCP2258527.1 Cytochrome P450 [Streptoalloteichus tenebrarius]BFF04110.1 cytochrome P450 [Streptoalloteichus tenebrarius]